MREIVFGFLLNDTPPVSVILVGNTKLSDECDGAIPCKFHGSTYVE